jgi:hypothetical protein
MAPDDDGLDEGRSPDIGAREQDPRVAVGRPTPDDSARPGKTFVGFLGDSPRPGYRRLYFDPALTRFAEFAAGDVIDHSPIPPDQPPFPGEQATRVTFRPGAPMELGQSLTTDDLDLEPLPPVPFGGGAYPGGIDAYGSRRGWCPGPRTEPPDITTDWCMGSRRWWCPW